MGQYIIDVPRPTARGLDCGIENVSVGRKL